MCTINQIPYRELTIVDDRLELDWWKLRDKMGRLEEEARECPWHEWSSSQVIWTRFVSVIKARASRGDSLYPSYCSQLLEIEQLDSLGCMACPIITARTSVTSTLYCQTSILFSRYLVFSIIKTCLWIRAQKIHGIFSLIIFLFLLIYRGL